jgi:hypothetical protein
MDLFIYSICVEFNDLIVLPFVSCSSEKSPKFSESLDQLHRRPLHSPPKDQSEAEVNSVEEDGSQVNKADIQTDMVDNVVSNLEQSDENISDGKLVNVLFLTVFLLLKAPKFS